MDEIQQTLGFGRIYVKADNGVAFWQTTSLDEVDRTLDAVEPFLFEKARQAGLLRRFRQIQRDTAPRRAMALRCYGDQFYDADSMHELLDIAVALNPRRDGSGRRYSRGRAAAELHRLADALYGPRTRTPDDAAGEPTFKQPELSPDWFAPWLAGFFDGDGCASISVMKPIRNGRLRIAYKPILSVSQHPQYRWVLHQIRRLSSLGEVPGCARQWLVVSREQQRRLIGMIRPYARVKGPSLDLFREALGLLDGGDDEAAHRLGARSRSRAAAMRVCEISTLLSPPRRKDGRYGRAWLMSDLAMLVEAVYSQPALPPRSVTGACGYCAKPIRKYPSAVRAANYCSRTCTGKARIAAYQADPTLAAGFNRAQPVKLLCRECSTPITTTPYRAARRNPDWKFCGRACAMTFVGRLNAGRAAVTKPCAECGVPFSGAKSKIGRYCGRACATAARTRELSRRGTEERICRHCRNPFRCRKSVKQQLCSRACQHAEERVTVNCALPSCGRPFTVSRSRVRVLRYCSAACGQAGKSLSLKAAANA